MNLDHRLQPARSHAGGTAHDVGFRNRRVEHPVGAEFGLQPGGQLEDSALALDHFLLEIFFAAAVGDVFAENDDALVAPHLVAQRGIDHVRHGFAWTAFLPSAAVVSVCAAGWVSNAEEVGSRSAE